MAVPQLPEFIRSGFWLNVICPRDDLLADDRVGRSVVRIRYDIKIPLYFVYLLFDVDGFEHVKAPRFRSALVHGKYYNMSELTSELLGAFRDQCEFMLRSGVAGDVLTQ